MQYNININQKAVAELNQAIGSRLDLVDATIIDFIAKFSHTGELNTKLIKDEVFYWVSYQKVIDENPLLEITNKEALARRLEKMVKAKILKRHIEKKEGNKTYFAFGTNYKKLISYDEGIDSKVERVSTQKSKGVSTQKSNNHITNRSLYQEEGGSKKDLPPKKQNSENEIQSEPPKKSHEPAKAHTTPSPLLEKLLEKLPEVHGLPHVRGIVEALEAKPDEEQMSYLEWVVTNKRQNPKLIEPKAWKDWFWLDYKGKDFQPAKPPPPPEIDGYVTSPDGRRYRTTALRPEDL